MRKRRLRMTRLVRPREGSLRRIVLVWELWRLRPGRRVLVVIMRLLVRLVVLMWCAARIGCSVVVGTNTRLNLCGRGESRSRVGLELRRVRVIQLWRLCWRRGVCVSRRAGLNVVAPRRRLLARSARCLLGVVVERRKRGGLRRLGEEGGKVGGFRDVGRVLVPRHAW